MKPLLALGRAPWCFLGIFNVILICRPLVGAENFPEKMTQTIGETIGIRQEMQKSEDQWAKEREKLSAQYDALIRKKENQRAIKERLKKEIVFYENRIESLEKQISDVSQISEGIKPFLEEVYERLTYRVEDGLPFLIQERTHRLNRLRGILDDPEVTVSEKFRKLMEAVQIEAEYGGTIEVYPQEISLNGKDIQANIFRLGRLSLFCQSLDQKTCGVYDAGKGEWVILPRKFNREIHTAIEIGSKRRPVEMVNLPVGRIVKK